MTSGFSGSRHDCSCSASARLGILCDCVVGRLAKFVTVLRYHVERTCMYEKSNLYLSIR